MFIFVSAVSVAKTDTTDFLCSSEEQSMHTKCTLDAHTHKGQYNAHRRCGQDKN